MREILFRGKRKADGRLYTDKWVYGALVTWPDGDTYIYHHTPLCNDEELYKAEVDTETVGQYTGFTDKQGRKIFEGDIVQMRTDGLSGYGTIVFKDGSFGIDDKKRRRFYYLYRDAVYRIDGNVHDNTELVGETK